MSKIYDLIIVGSGPAGLSAGLYSGRAKLNTLIIEKENVGGQVTKTYDISNYPGVRKTTGPKLMEEMRLQAEDFGVEFINTSVDDVELIGDVKTIKTSSGDLKARSIILASGAVPRTLGFPGEKEFTGRGVAYCSTCDGQFFEGLEVFVLGAGYAAAEEAMFLTKYAKKVTVIAREPEFTCAKSIADKVLAHPKVEVKFHTEIVEAKGEEMINYAKFINNQTGETFEHFADKNDGAFGIFVFVGYAPQTEVFVNKLEMDKWGYVLTNENMETNIKGVYAAGDLRPKLLRQIVTAVADGAIAATAAEKYVAEEKERLGIKEEEVVEVKKEKKKEDAESTELGNINRKSKLLNDGLRAQLKGVLAKVERKITLVTIVDEQDEKSIELRDLVIDIADLSDKISAVVKLKGEDKELECKINADKLPVVAFLNSNGEYVGVKFHGVPGGHELNSFILAIYNLGGPGQGLADDVISNIKSLDKKANVKVCVSLACHLCPDVVVAAQRIAIENKEIEAEMIDIANFKELKDKHKIMSVPALIINDEKVYFGAKKIDEIINYLK